MKRQLNKSRNDWLSPVIKLIEQGVEMKERACIQLKRALPASPKVLPIARLFEWGYDLNQDNALSLGQGIRILPVAEASSGKESSFCFMCCGYSLNGVILDVAHSSLRQVVERSEGQ